MRLNGINVELSIALGKEFGQLFKTLHLGRLTGSPYHDKDRQLGSDYPVCQLR